MFWVKQACKSCIKAYNVYMLITQQCDKVIIIVFQYLQVGLWPYYREIAALDVTQYILSTIQNAHMHNLQHTNSIRFRTSKNCQHRSYHYIFQSHSYSCYKGVVEMHVLMQFVCVLYFYRLYPSIQICCCNNISSVIDTLLQFIAIYWSKQQTCTQNLSAFESDMARSPFWPISSGQ